MSGSQPPRVSHTSVSSLLRQAVATPPGTRASYSAYLEARATSPSPSLSPAPAPSVGDEEEQHWRGAAPSQWQASAPVASQPRQQVTTSPPPVFPVLVALAAQVRHSPRTAAEALWARRVGELVAQSSAQSSVNVRPLGRGHTEAELLSARLEARALLAAAEAAHKQPPAADG
jgi:hypothetical protein